jgi:hypothetical protein
MLPPSLACAHHLLRARLRYLAKPGARPYCSAQPSGVLLDAFGGADFLLPPGGVAAL